MYRYQYMLTALGVLLGIYVGIPVLVRLVIWVSSGIWYPLRMW